MCVFVCVLSSSDISSNAVDISRGFEDLIPSVFEELCAALLGNTERKPPPQQSHRRALPFATPRSTAFVGRPVLVRPKCDRWQGPRYTLSAFLEMTGSLLGLLLSLAVFPLSCGVFLLLSTEAEKAITKRYERRKYIEMVWEGSERGRASKKV